MSVRVPRPIIMLAMLLAACEAGPETDGSDAAEVPPVEVPRVDEGPPVEEAPPAEDGPLVEVWFSRGEAPARVERRVAEATPQNALEALLAGPTAAERAAGLSSWFSDSTAGSLAGVERGDGYLVVDFRDLDRRIPGAGSSAGSAQLLASLDSTVFQFPSIDSVEYRLGGSCEAFWEWLQRGCEVVRRP